MRLFSIFFQCTYINGSPQNTFVPGVVELARQKKVFLGGDDFKSGQTKIKSVLVDFLVSAGIKVSYLSHVHRNHNGECYLYIHFSSRFLLWATIIWEITMGRTSQLQGNSAPKRYVELCSLSPCDSYVYAYAMFLHFQISKSNVVDDMVDSNSILYQPGEKPDHCVSIHPLYI